MSIRLNKVTRDLNVGMSTLLDFLQKRGHVVENNPNSKITEEEYELLVKEFSRDMSLKQEAERLVQERTNRDKPKVETPVAAPVVTPVEDVTPVVPRMKEEVINLRPHIKQVGKIDLDALNKKHKPEEKVIPGPKVEKTIPEPKIQHPTDAPVVKEAVVQPSSSASAGSSRGRACTYKRIRIREAC